jgi:thiamine-phosphate diphosphorylase
MSWEACVKPLPSNHYFFTEKGELSQAQFLANLQKCFERGYLFFRFRAEGFDAKTYAKWAHGVAELARQYQACMMVDNLAVLKEVQAQGLHASQVQLLTYESRPVADTILFAASVHDMQTCAWANRVQTDLVTLSPVKATQSHPNVVPMGWERFHSIAQHSACPVYALGGLTPEDLAVAQQHGAHGIAAIRGVWGL